MYWKFMKKNRTQNTVTCSINRRFSQFNYLNVFQISLKIIQTRKMVILKASKTAQTSKRIRMHWKFMKTNHTQNTVTYSINRIFSRFNYLNVFQIFLKIIQTCKMEISKASKIAQTSKRLRMLWKRMKTNHTQNTNTYSINRKFSQFNYPNVFQASPKITQTRKMEIFKASKTAQTSKRL